MEPTASSFPKRFCYSGLFRLSLLCAIVFLTLCLLFPVQVKALDDFKVGFLTLGFSYLNEHLRLDVNVWYPSVRNPRELNYAPYTIMAAREGKPCDGQFPLLIVSHPSPGTRFSYHDTCSWLASQGYVVAAPTHTFDCMDNMQRLFTWEQFRGRARDISRLIDELPKHKLLASVIDSRKIGLVGFGSGGTTALLLGGALPNCISWPDYCSQAGKKDLYCNPWSREKVNAICREFPLKKHLKDPRIKALAIVSPAFGMLFSPSSFQNFTPPLLVITAGKDTLNDHRLHADVLTGYLRAQSRSLFIPEADMGALMAPCPESLAKELSELCLSVSHKERVLIHKRLREALASFFSEELNKTEEESSANRTKHQHQP
ncbi:MAG: dienelactone hydrolase family protein [Desulfovibrio sp.]|nr:dienelactone hydrolase family protein [Desulfovibrio sp.]